MRTSVGLPHGELGRRQRTRRAAHDRQAFDSQMIQKRDQCIGLMRRRCIIGKGAAQITEARWRNDFEAALTQSAGKQQTLIETAAGAVDHHHRRAVPGNGIFKHPGARLDQGALTKEPALDLCARLAESAHGIASTCKRKTTQTQKQVAPRCHSCPLTSYSGSRPAAIHRAGPNRAGRRPSTSERPDRAWVSLTGIKRSAILRRRKRAVSGTFGNAL